MRGKEAIVRRKEGGNSPMAINDSIIPYGDDEMSHPIVKANCKLCNSEFRDEAENMFLQQRKPNFNVILLFLKGQGEEISFQAVKNHLVNHYKAHFRKEFLTEYSDDIKRWIDNQPNKVNAIRQRIAVLEKEMVEIASEGSSLQLEDRRKNADIAAFDSPWRFSSLYEDAIYAVDNKIKKLSREREEMTYPSINPKKGWV